MGEGDREKQLKRFLPEFQRLEGWEKCQAMLLPFFAETDLEYMRTALAFYIGWHDKQHSASQTCDHCQPLRDLITTYGVIQSYQTQFKASAAKAR
jgi:hypothetical protein